MFFQANSSDSVTLREGGGGEPPMLAARCMFIAAQIRIAASEYREPNGTPPRTFAPIVAGLPQGLCCAVTR